MSNKEYKSKLDLKELNKFVFEEAEHFRNLQILGYKIVCPYFINRPAEYFIDLMRISGIDEKTIFRFYEDYKNNKIPYGWFQGKGTSIEIENAIEHFISSNRPESPNKVTPDGIRELMSLRGIGVDCSGFVFNILRDGFKKMGCFEEFLNGLKWNDENKKNVSQANVKLFIRSSTVVRDFNIQPLDLIVMEGHIAIVLKINDGALGLYQSTPWTSPNGISVSDLSVANEEVNFSFVPNMGVSWNEKYQRGEIEFRRLKIFQ